MEIDKAIEQVKAEAERAERAASWFTDVATSLAASLPDICAKAPMGRAIDVCADLAKTVDLLEERFKALKNEVTKMKELYLPERFEAEEVTTFNTDRFRVTKSTRTYASVIGEQEDAFKWLRENGYESLIKPTVNASSLSAVAKELMEGGRELDDELFRVYNKNGVSITVKKQDRA